MGGLLGCLVSIGDRGEGEAVGKEDKWTGTESATELGEGVVEIEVDWGLERDIEGGHFRTSALLVL